jgi:hypothetical protein
MNKIKLSILPLILSFIVLYLSLHHEAWVIFWKILHIPALTPPFSDMDSLLKTNLSKNAGFNVYLENPYDPTHGLYVYPLIWLSIVDFLKLNNPVHFQILNFLVIFSYFFIIQSLFIKDIGKLPSYLIVIFFFSTTNFLTLERLNVDIIIFSLIYFAIISNKNTLKSFFFLIALLGKVYPILSIFFLIDKKKYFLLILFLSTMYLFFFKEDIYFMATNMIEFARIFAYGAGSISKGIYYYSREYNLFINDNNYIYLKSSIILLFTVIALLLAKKNFIFGDKNINKKMTINERLFLAGGGIYLGTFIFSANVDYRLVFLLFTISYILEVSNNFIKYIYFISCSIIFNSFIFAGGEPYSITYLLKAGFIYSFKFIVFGIICYFFGKIVNNYVLIQLKILKN